MSNRLFQGIIHQMKDAVDRIIGVIDNNGIIISCSDLTKIGGTRQGIRDELSYASDTVMSGGYTYRPIENGLKSEFIVFVEGEDKQAERLAYFNSTTDVHFALVYRGDEARANEYIKVQDAYLASHPIDNTPNKEADNG